MMGGTVTAASVMGLGSAFSLRFPDVEVSSRLASTTKAEPLVETDFNDLRPARLLVVDDNETNCRLIEGVFSGSHHELHYCTSGEEAVRKARELQPDIVLMDIRMPGMDGRQSLLEIRKIPGRELTPVIAVTASSLLSEEKELKERFSGYVRKPFTKRELFDELAQFLPPAPKTGITGSDGEILGSGAGAENDPAPPELLAELQRLLKDEWPSVRDSLAINESKEFAQKLEGLARQWPSQPLLVYARELARHAENYAVVDLEKRLKEFDGLVERLRQAKS
jgi:CheY-like chemotaxis protein